MGAPAPTTSCEHRRFRWPDAERRLPASGGRAMSSRTSRRALLRGAFGLATTVAITPILAACGGTATPAAPSKPAEAPAKAPDKPAAAPTTAAATGAGAAASKSASGAEIVYLNQSRGQAKAMGMLAEQYTQKTGVKVTIDSPGPIDYPK